MMNIVLLSGGSGKRLWPLSNEVRSKQFLKIFQKEDGTKESMAQRMYRMIKEVNPDANVTIATSANQIPQIKSQLGDNVSISVEPVRRDTFPAIALASSFLRASGVDLDEPVVVCPVDPFVERDYFECLDEMSKEAAKEDAANITLMGIEPTYPSEKYGYIIPTSSSQLSSVSCFREKPDEATAKEYIRQNALWNGGIFAFKLGYLLDIAESVFGFNDYDTLLEQYGSLKKISFDYAVVEKEKSINVLRFNGQWKDMGTWNTLTEAMDEIASGNTIVAGCTNTHVINELDIPLITLGVQNVVVAATPDGILVSDKLQSSELKNYVSDSRPMYERRVWGEYKVLDYKLHSDGQNSLTKELIIAAGEHISYQRHSRRTEIWTFTEGTGVLIIDDEAVPVKRGDVKIIQKGMKHAVKANTELHIIEVQIGDELNEEDIERFDWSW